MASTQEPAGQPDTGTSSYDLSLNDLPDEILEYILSLLSPYADFASAYRVSQRWRSCCRRVCQMRLKNFIVQLNELKLQWEELPQLDQSPGSVSKRYSHSSVYYSPSMTMYMFGGCSASQSTFNDLWQLDLSSRKWFRTMATGTYPSPKACSSLAIHEDSLVLFGGWTHPATYPLHQTWKLFSELHIYSILENRWTKILDDGICWPPPSAGHSATVHRDKYVVFGGLKEDPSTGLCAPSNSVWVFNLSINTWCLYSDLGDRAPPHRYGQSQIWLDDDHLLIFGGCNGSNVVELVDVWMLSMDKDQWRWTKLNVIDDVNRPKDLWKHPSVRVGDKVFMLGKSKVKPKELFIPQVNVAAGAAANADAPTRNAIGLKPVSHPRTNRVTPQEASRSSGSAVGGPDPRPGTLSGRRHLEQRLPITADTGTSSSAGSSSEQARLAARQRNFETRQMQQAARHRLEERMRTMSRESHQASARGSSGQNNSSSVPRCPNHRMSLHVLDISTAISQLTVRWLPPSPLPPGVDAPEETILYTLVKGREEFVMFGGIKRDISVSNRETALSGDITNTLYFMVPSKQPIV